MTDLGHRPLFEMPAWPQRGTQPGAGELPLGSACCPRSHGMARCGRLCVGELALLFSMTRPNRSASTVPYAGGVPPSVWLFLGFFCAGAARTGWKGAAALRRAWEHR